MSTFIASTMKALTVGWLVVLAIMKNVSCSKDLFILDASRMTAKEGSCVKISCTVNDRVNAAGAHWFWIKDHWLGGSVLTGTVIYSTNTSRRPVSADFADRVKEITALVPNSEGFLTTRKKSSILLCDLKKSDNGGYSFRFEGEAKWFTYPVELSVKDNPCLITFEQQPVLKENDPVTLICSTLSSWCSNPVIKRWRPPTSLSTQNQNSRYKKSTTTRFTDGWQHDGEEFSCETASDNYVIRKISVEYAPRDTQADKRPAVVVEGGSVTLKCSAKGRPDPEFTWFRNQNEEIRRGAEHKITAILGSQSGDYHCEAKNKLGTLKSKPVRIDVTYRPEVEVTSSTATYEQGAEMTLKCHVRRSNPPPRVFTWFKDGKAVGEERTQRYVKVVEPEDAGEYKCSASNARGKGTSKPFTVEVQYGPRNTAISFWSDGQSVTQSVRVSKSMTFNCQTEANPAPLGYSWYRNNNIMEVDSSRWVSETARGEKLKLVTVEREDGGCYTCTATNSIRAGEQSGPVCIEVLYAPTGASLSMKTEVTEGQLITISCTVESSPASELNLTLTSESNPQSPKVLFTHSGRDQRPNNLVHTFQVTSSHAGVYACHATNSEGSKTSERKKLVVNYSPKDVTVTARPSLVVEEKEPLTLECSARCHPPVTSVTWMKTSDGEPEVLGKTKSFFLKSVGPSDSGQYVCEASNDLGTGTSPPTEIKVKYAPKLTKVTETEHRGDDGRSFVTLSCSSQSYPPVTQYAWYKTKAEDQNEEVSDGQNHTVYSDQPGSYYCVAWNGNYRKASSPVHLFERNGRLTLLIIPFVLVLLTVSLIVVYREKRKRSGQQAATNTCGLGFLWEPIQRRWNSGQRNPTNDPAAGEPFRSRDDLLPDRLHRPKAPRWPPHPDSTPAANIHSIYCTVNQAGHREDGNTPEDSLNYASVRFGKINQLGKTGEDFYVKLSKQKPPEKSDERQEDYENAVSARVGRDPDPRSYDTDTSEEELEVDSSWDPPALNRNTEEGGNTPEDSLNYASVRFGKINQRAKAGEHLYAKLSKQKPPEKSDERQEDYENAVSARVGRDPDPRSCDTDTSEEELDDGYSRLGFTAKPGRGGGGRDSSKV